MTLCEPWIDDDDLCAPCDTETLDPTLLATLRDSASELLYVLSGRQFPGICNTATVRPYLRRQDCGFDPWTRRVDNTEVILSHFPIVSIGAVKVRESNDGTLETLDSSLYRLDNSQILVRLDNPDGSNPGWPLYQDLNQNEGGDGRFFEVTYDWGQAPPAAGKKAAAILTCELALACNPATQGKCRLPARTQSIVRQGVSVEFVDAAQFLEDDLTGLYEVDMFLKAYNPRKLRRRGTVWSPDLPAMRS